MPAVRIEPFAGRPLLDIASFGRRGPGRREQLTSAQIAQVARTVGRTPEVMVKVLTRNATDLGSVRRHLDYVGRDGDLELETDEGDRISGKGVGRDLVDDWNLDLEDLRKGDKLTATNGRKSPKLVHKLIFSMPAGTPPNAVLAASRNFLREEFALKHRYAYVLHTDEPHPHVHAVVKAVSEDGVRLTIRKEVLRRWRSEFARHLRAEGVAANATERAVRGQPTESKIDPIYRAMKSPIRESTFMREKLDRIANVLTRRRPWADPADSRVRTTRAAVVKGWQVLAEDLLRNQQMSLAAQVQRFVAQMSPARTDAERLAAQLVQKAHDRTMLVRERVR